MTCITGASRRLCPREARRAAVLAEAAGRLRGRRVGMHAAAALAQVSTVPGKVLRGSGRDQRVETVTTGPARLTESSDRPSTLLEQAYGDLEAAAETFGHIRLTEQLTRLGGALAETGQRSTASSLTERLADTLEDRGVLPRVVGSVRRQAATLSE